MDLKMQAEPGGDVIVAWTQMTPATRLYAARFNISGARLWHGPVNQSYRHRESIGATQWAEWGLAADGAGGILVTWLRKEVGVPEIGAQRLNSGGSPLWGADGISCGAATASASTIP